MKRLDKMLYEARLLDAQTREYKPCYLVEMTEHGAWSVRGFKRRFESESEAVEFCDKQAAGRPVGIVICDIPRILPEGDLLDTCAVSETDALKELIDHGIKSSVQFC